MATRTQHAPEQAGPPTRRNDTMPTRDNRTREWTEASPLRENALWYEPAGNMRPRARVIRTRSSCLHASYTWTTHHPTPLPRSNKTLAIYKRNAGRAAVLDYTRAWRCTATVAFPCRRRHHSLPLHSRTHRTPLLYHRCVAAPRHTE